MHQACALNPLHCKCSSFTHAKASDQLLRSAFPLHRLLVITIFRSTHARHHQQRHVVWRIFTLAGLCKQARRLLRAADSTVTNIAAAAADCAAAAFKPHEKRTHSAAKALVTQEKRLRGGGAVCDMCGKGGCGGCGGDDDCEFLRLQKHGRERARVTRSGMKERGAGRMRQARRNGRSSSKQPSLRRRPSSRGRG
jgi:hypothetical protein